MSDEIKSTENSIENMANSPAVPVVATHNTDLAFVISDYQVNLVEAWLINGNVQEVEEFINDLYDADVADLLEKIDDDLRIPLIALLQKNFEPEIFTYLSANVREQVIQQLDPRQVAHLVSELDSDDALDLLLYLEPETRQRIYRHLSYAIRAQVEESLTFPEDSAGRLMQREVVAVPQFWTVGKTLDYLHAGSETLPDDYYNIFVTDSSGQVVGILPVSRLLGAMRSVRISDISNDDIHTIPATTDQEEVAFLFRRYGLVSAPVVDDQNRLIGMVTSDDVVDIVSEEADEDILQLGGVNPESDIDASIMQTTRDRFGWLFINLITAILASSVISLFENSLEKIVALAVLMPICASMGGNAGTQTLTVSVRALAMKELNMGNALRIVWKESIVGGLNGFLFAVITGIIAALWFNQSAIGFVIGAAMIINLIAAGFAGATIPLLLQRFKFDPAIGSVVILTTVTDVVGFFVFLGIATLVLL